MKMKYIILIFAPAIAVAILAIFVRFMQYEPLMPNEEDILALKNTQGLQIPIYAEDPIIGNKKAPTTVVAFEDFGCGGCATQSAIFDQLIKKYPDKIKLVWKGIPVTQFPHPTDMAHEYAFCANKQNKFYEFSKLAFSNSNNLSQEILNAISDKIELNKKKLVECIDSGDAKIHIQKTEQLGMALNIQSVPTFFLNNKQINQPQILEGWEAVLGL